MKWISVWINLAIGTSAFAGALESTPSWFGSFQHIGSRNGEHTIHARFDDGVLRFDGFYDENAFQAQDDGSYFAKGLGIVQFEEVSFGEPPGITIARYAFPLEQGFLVGRTQALRRDDQLCKIQLTCSTPFTLSDLVPGVERLHGGYRPTIRTVDDILLEHTFVQVRWRSTPTYRIQVEASGYLYALKMYDQTRLKSERAWEESSIEHHRHLLEPTRLSSMGREGGAGGAERI